MGGSLTALRMSVVRSDELVHPIGRALDPLVRGRFAPEGKRIVIRSAVRGTRSVPRTLYSVQRVVSPDAMAVHRQNKPLMPVLALNS